MTVTTIDFWTLAAAWGIAVATPVARRAARVGVVTRAGLLSTRAPARRSRLPTRRRVAAVVRAHADVAGMRVVSSLWARRRARRNDAALRREIPVAFDLLGIAVGAGCTPYLAVEVAARWSPTPLAGVFTEVLRRCALGLDFEASLDHMASTAPALRPIADALLASDRLGIPVGRVIARLAEEDRTALQRAAEAHARRIPVRLLFPLVFVVLPAFVLLTVVPSLAGGLGRL